MITITNLKKYFNNGQIKAVDDVSFEVNKGEIVGFLGPNGAGKSTTLRIITGYIPLTSGEVSIAGRKIEGVDDTREMIGYLPESTPLYSNMKTIEFLNFVADIRGLKGDFRKERIDFVIDKLSLAKKAYQSISGLSKGFKQRVGLAQAIIHDPQVLVLDEPTSGLDPNQVMEIRALIQSISKDKTVIFSTHILQEVEALCDRVVIINDGKIVAIGSKDELTNSNTNIVTLLVKGAKAKAISALKGINDIAILESTERKDGLLIKTESVGDKRLDIFNCAKDNGFAILEMNKESANLEQLFKEVTGGRK